MGQSKFVRSDIRQIVAALGPHLGDYQILLVFDACKAHLGSFVFATCASLGVWPVVVPPRLTWLLQLLDTHVYLSYKGAIRGANQDSHAVRPLDNARFLQCMYDAIEETMQRRSRFLGQRFRGEPGMLVRRGVAPLATRCRARAN